MFHLAIGLTSLDEYFSTNLLHHQIYILYGVYKINEIFLTWERLLYNIYIFTFD